MLRIIAELFEEFADVVVEVAEELVGLGELDLVVEHREFSAYLVGAELAVASEDQVVKD